jgi:adiponectin receptor
MVWFSRTCKRHFIFQFGFKEAMNQVSLHYTLIMGLLYLTGALLYATRIPERFLPGKCDIWFQSHQVTIPGKPY